MSLQSSSAGRVSCAQEEPAWSQHHGLRRCLARITCRQPAGRAPAHRLGSAAGEELALLDRKSSGEGAECESVWISLMVFQPESSSKYVLLHHTSCCPFCQFLRLAVAGLAFTHASTQCKQNPLMLRLGDESKDLRVKRRAASGKHRMRVVE